MYLPRFTRQSRLLQLLIDILEVTNSFIIAEPTELKNEEQKSEDKALRPGSAVKSARPRTGNKSEFLPFIEI